MGTIRIGLSSRVTVELVERSGETEQRTFTIVNGKQADIKSGLLDENTPLARILMGRTAGETAPYSLGDLVEVRILAVEPGGGDVSPQAAQKRRRAVRQAEAASEITNQMIFATASGSKWGDYDVNVDKLLNEGDNEETPQEQG